jgi:hypothetical protein
MRLFIRSTQGNEVNAITFDAKAAKTAGMKVLA